MRSVAVCCGFNHYDHVPSLACAMNDAVHPYAELTTNPAFNCDPGLAQLGQVFTQQTTSAQDILEAFARAARSSARLVWFSFSGHGIVGASGELRLVLPAWRGDDSEDDRVRWSIAASDLESVMRPHLAQKRFVVVIDTCYSGAFGGAGVTREVQPTGGCRIASAGVVVISACGRDQVASDGYLGPSRALGRVGTKGSFTSAVIDVLRDRGQARAPLSVLELFLETKRRMRNGQRPMLFANALTEDFAILDGAPPPSPEDADDDIARVSVEVPRKLQHELGSFLKSVVQIVRKKRVGLLDAKRQLLRLAGEFLRYDDDAFVVSGTNANVVEAFDGARACVIGCTTQPYFEEWQRSGIALLAANEVLIQQRGGRVFRFFFVQDDFQDRLPGAINAIRDQLKAGVHAVLVHVDSFGSSVLEAVFNDPAPRDLSSLECAFVDDKIFLKVHFIANGHSKIEIDQGATRCQYEYKTLLQPFLSAGHGRFFGASVDPVRHDEVIFTLLARAEVAALRRQLESDLGLVPRGPGPAFGQTPPAPLADALPRLGYGG